MYLPVPMSWCLRPTDVIPAPAGEGNRLPSFRVSRMSRFREGFVTLALQLVSLPCINHIAGFERCAQRLDKGIAYSPDWFALSDIRIAVTPDLSAVRPRNIGIFADMPACSNRPFSFAQGASSFPRGAKRASSPVPFPAN
jgi:hypothetical protein